MRDEFNSYSSINGKDYTIIVKDRNTGLMAEVTGTLKLDKLDNQRCFELRERAYKKLEFLLLGGARS